MGKSPSLEAARSSAKQKSSTDSYNVRISAEKFVGNILNTSGKNGGYILIEKEMSQRLLQLC